MLRIKSFNGDKKMRYLVSLGISILSVLFWIIVLLCFGTKGKEGLIGAAWVLNIIGSH